MGAGSGISGKRALSSLRVCSTVRNILPPQDGLILRPSHAVPDGRRAASEMSDNVQLFPWETRDGLWAESGLSFPGDACAGAAVLLGAFVVLKSFFAFFAAKDPFDVMCQCGLLKYHGPKTKKKKIIQLQKE